MPWNGRRGGCRDRQDQTGGEQGPAGDSCNGDVVHRVHATKGSAHRPSEVLPNMKFLGPMPLLSPHPGPMPREP